MTVKLFIFLFEILKDVVEFLIAEFVEKLNQDSDTVFILFEVSFSHLEINIIGIIDLFIFDKTVDQNIEVHLIQN